MPYRGRVRNGVVVLDEASSLEDGIEVQVEVLPKKEEKEPLGKQLLRFAGIAEGLPSDIARNHDHYLHGSPKK